eukprot:159078-Amphidinium_carterae.1
MGPDSAHHQRHSQGKKKGSPYLPRPASKNTAQTEVCTKQYSAAQHRSSDYSVNRSQVKWQTVQARVARDAAPPVHPQSM